MNAGKGKAGIDLIDAGKGKAIDHVDVDHINSLHGVR